MKYLASQALLVEDAPLLRVGGKGAGLARLARVDLPVPPFFVLTTRAWEDCDDGRGPLPISLRAELVEAWQALGGGPLAVRSSAVVEDGSDASWAGQFTSFLGVSGPAALADAVTGCWASGRTERVAAYGELHGVQAGAMAVVLQALVQGQVSGVLFSRDPDDPERALISAGLGLGEGVVQGAVPCDTYRVSGDGEVEAQVDDKDAEVLLVDGELAEVPVTDERRDAPALGDAMVERLARIGRLLESELGVPVDVEFTVDDGTLWVLQVRPIAVPVATGRRLLWDNSNIVESYSGVTTPLTFSFASRVYTIVYQLFCRIMGVDEDTIRANEPTYRRMIGYVRGRVFYNLNAWYRVLSLLPGFRFNKGAMETMMGVSEVASDEDAGGSRGQVREGLDLLRLFTRLGWRLWRLPADSRAFQAHFTQTMAEVRALDLDALRPDELLDVYERAERELLWAWTPPLVNDFFTMIFYKLLQKAAGDVTGDPDTQLHNRLLAGSGSLASAAPARDLVELAAVVRDSDNLAAWFRSDQPDAVVLDEALRHLGFRARWDRWFDQYGDRSPDELKLEAPPLSDTPEYVLQTLRGWLQRDELPDLAAAEGETRRQAEDEWRRAVRGPLRRLRLGWVLRQARARVYQRESLRLERTRVFGFVRRLFRAFGDRFVEAGALGTRDDVFFLTVDEILGFVRGTTVTTDLRALVAVRRAEHARHVAAQAPSDRFHTWGAVHLSNRFAGRIGPADLEGDALQGTPSSPGQVRAPARVVRDPREVPDLHGGLLVAERTDPGWVPLFPTASGVLVERGSLLSHSAVVARELGLPAIVGLRGLLDWAVDGEELEMDGRTGVVQRPSPDRGSDG